MTQAAMTPTVDQSCLDSSRCHRGQSPIEEEDGRPATCLRGNSNFGRVLKDAILLLTHAAAKGVDVDETTSTSILTAKATGNSDWNYAGAANLLTALATLAAKLRPVTADRLRASCSDLVEPDIRTLRMSTCLLAVPIILFSVLNFVSSSMSAAIRSDISTANEFW